VPSHTRACATRRCGSPSATSRSRPATRGRFRSPARPRRRRRQGRFWEFHDSLFEDAAHSDDPHLWARARTLGLDVEHFDRDRRAADVAEIVRDQTRAGMRAGIAGTPTFVIGDALLPGIPPPDLIDRLTG
jgi:predicted DsbA family dithiol-disulfide isomerase